MTSLVTAAAFVLLLQSPPSQPARIDGSWLVFDPGTGQQLGTMEVRVIADGEYSFQGDFKTTFAGGVPPAWLGSGKFSGDGGDYYWSSFDGREGRTAIRRQGGRLLLDVRCLRGTCTGGEFRYAATRVVPSGAAPAAPVRSVPAASAPARPIAPPVATRMWQELRHADGGFRADFPGAARLEVKQVEDKFDGVTRPHHQWQLELDNNWTAYIVGFADLSPGRIASASADVILGDAVQGGVRNVSGTLLSDTRITVQGYPGREIVVSVVRDGSTLTVRTRVLLVNRRIYTLVAVNHAENSRLEAGEVDRFLNSFRLLDR